jgi:hypothetical protein
MAKKVMKLSISRLIFEQHEKIFRSSLLTLDSADYAKKPSHATVPLNTLSPPRPFPSGILTTTGSASLHQQHNY